VDPGAGELAMRYDAVALHYQRWIGCTTATMDGRFFEMWRCEGWKRRRSRGTIVVVRCERACTKGREGTNAKVNEKKQTVLPQLMLRT